MNATYLPALRGIFGDWIYYSCLIPMNELANRINFADEIHKNKELSKLIQRELKEKRGREISTYLHKEKEKFLGTLVIAVYGGEPTWYEASITPTGDHVDKDLISEDALHSVGFLGLSGKEKMFAIDGQHRLAGIKLAIEEGANENDEINVILVAHNNNKKGLERTRRLFTTLNKMAKKVSMGETIALDENDLMAIVTRKLVEESDIFKNKRVAFRTTTNITERDTES